jgi:hypothetical protein
VERGSPRGATPPTFDSVNAEHARLVEQALRVGGENRRYVAGTGADPKRLRGIPAIGRSVSGGDSGHAVRKESAQMTEPLDLDPIRTRLKAASRGPWRWEDWGDPPVDHERSAHTLASDELRLTKAICTAAEATSMWKNPADADLIAHAPSDIGALIARWSGYGAQTPRWR